MKALARAIGSCAIFVKGLFTFHPHLTVLASEASWAVTLGLVLDGHTLPAVLTEVAAVAVHGPAVVLAGGTGGPGLLSALTLETLTLSGQRLE